MQRISLIPGNFFEDQLPDADVFVLSRIIHDWVEPKAKVLLKKIYDKLPSGGAVLVCEMILDEDGCGPIDSLLQSLSIYLFYFFTFYFFYFKFLFYFFNFLFLLKSIYFFR